MSGSHSPRESARSASCQPTPRQFRRHRENGSLFDFLSHLFLCEGVCASYGSGKQGQGQVYAFQMNPFPRQNEGTWWGRCADSMLVRPQSQPVTLRGSTAAAFGVWKCASRCVQLACCKPDPQRFRIANTSPTPDIMSATELGSGVATAVNVKVPQLKAKSLPVRPPHVKPPPPSSVSWKVNVFGMVRKICRNQELVLR
jgi:hypothetical protein